MPRPAKLPDLSDVTELKLTILAVLERHGMGPEWRRSVRGGQIGAMLDQCGGARQVLADALAAVRPRRETAVTSQGKSALSHTEISPRSSSQRWSSALPIDPLAVSIAAASTSRSSASARTFSSSRRMWLLPWAGQSGELRLSRVADPRMIFGLAVM